MDFDTAYQIVKQFFSRASDPLLTTLLNQYAVNNNGVAFFRPYIVAAIFMVTEYRRLVKADVASWEYSTEAIRSLIATQAAIDRANNLIIPDELSGNEHLPPDDSGGFLGIMLI